MSIVLRFTQFFYWTKKLFGGKCKLSIHLHDLPHTWQQDNSQEEPCQECLEAITAPLWLRQAVEQGLVSPNQGNLQKSSQFFSKKYILALIIVHTQRQTTAGTNSRQIMVQPQDECPALISPVAVTRSRATSDSGRTSPSATKAQKRTQGQRAFKFIVICWGLSVGLRCNSSRASGKEEKNVVLVFFLALSSAKWHVVSRGDNKFIFLFCLYESHAVCQK